MNSKTSSTLTNPIATLFRFAAVPLLLIGCTTSSASDCFVVLESDSYGCGAAEGLGCGLAIAPVLVAIDELDGVAESSVSWDGRYFRLEVHPGADPDEVALAAAGLLEGESCCVTAPRGKASPAKPDEWYNAEGTLALSRHEAGVIASDFASKIAAEITLEPARAERLHTVLREELERSFERAHAAGGGVHRLWEHLPQARADLESRLDFLTSDEKSRVLAVLDRELEEG